MDSLEVEIGSKYRHDSKPKSTKKVQLGNFSESTKITAPSVLQKIFRSRNQQNSQYYFSGSSVARKKGERNVMLEVTPFLIPKELEEFSYKVLSREWRDKQRSEEKQKSSFDKPSYRSRNNQDILRRLYVKKPEDNVDALTDIDPQYFHVAAGRPIVDKTDLRTYLKEARQCLRTKLSIGFKEDEILLMERNYVEESNLVTKLNNDYESFMSSYKEFLARDYGESMQMLNEANNLADLSNQKTSEFVDLSRQLGMVKIDLYKLEEQWRNCKLYQTFLYQISPFAWRKEHDYLTRTNKGNHENLVNDSTAFSKYRLPFTGDVASLEILLEMVLNDIDNEEEPLLYFKDPSELFPIFSFLESQNLNSLLHYEYVSAPLQRMSAQAKDIEKSIDCELEETNYFIRFLEKRISWNETRRCDLEDIAKQELHYLVKDIVTNNLSLSLYIWIQDLYESIIATNDARLSLYEMMKAVEICHESCMMRLDNIPYRIAQKAVMEQREKSRMESKMAKCAKRQMDAINLLVKKLRVVLLPPPKRRTKRSLVWRTKPICEEYKSSIAFTTSTYSYEMYKALFG